MRYLLSLVLVLFVVRLVVGAVRGRVRLRSCCAVDARSDVRLRSAADD